MDAVTTTSTAATSSDSPFGPNVILQDLIAQCAESKVWGCKYGEKDAVIKHRFAKAYRHPSLDTKLRIQRTQREAKALVRAKKLNVATPNVYNVDKQTCTIVMERIRGRAVRDVINEVAAKIPHVILRARANDVFLRTIKVDESEEAENAPAVPLVSPGAAESGSPMGMVHTLPGGHGVSTGNSSHPHSHFAITQNPPSAAAIVASSGVQLSADETQAAIANLEALDQLGRILLTKMGAIIGSLHNGDMIHGDLTTANFMSTSTTTPAGGAASSDNNTPTAPTTTSCTSSVAAAASSSSSSATTGSFVTTADGAVTTTGELILIDFGLVRDSANAEERAVDLYVLTRAVASAHPYLTLVLETVLLGYNMTIAEAKGKATMDRLVAVKARGRKRSMIG